MNVKYIIQARFNSARLPEKISKKIGDKNLLEHIVSRLLTMGALKSEILLAMADEEHEKIKPFLENLEMDYVLGNTHNVLERYIFASNGMAKNDLIVRLTGDNPFLDYNCLQDNLLQFKNNSEIEYSFPYKLPIGMGYEIIRKAALDRQQDHDLKPHHKEHVTMFIKENPGLFCIRPAKYFENERDIRLTIDYPEDLEQARKTYLYFQEQGRKYFCSTEVFHLYDSTPDFFCINRLMKQKKPTEYEKQISK